MGRQEMLLRLWECVFFADERVRAGPRPASHRQTEPANVTSSYVSGHLSADPLSGNESQGWWFQLAEHTLLTLDFVWVTGGFGQP